MGIEDEYIDVLQNIEFGIAAFYRENPDLSDYDVIRTLEALIYAYKAEATGRTQREQNLSDTEQALMADVQKICEWRLGRESLEVEVGEEDDTPPAPITVDEILLCLKKILQSVRRWNEMGGRQGYLDFIVNYV